MEFLVTDLYKTANIETFKNTISQGEEIFISFPLSSVGFSQSHMDIVRDYAETSFCCETIAPYISVLNSEFFIRDKYHTDFKIKCKPVNPEEFTDTILYFAEMLTQELKEYDDIDVISFHDEITEYEESFDKRIFTFPELINSYWANMINGAYWEIASEYYQSESKFFNKIYRKHPEHRFGFWKSPTSLSLEDSVYFSTDNWIIPPRTNIHNALKVYSEVDNIHLDNADKIEYKGKTILITYSTAVYFNQHNAFVNSLKCVKFAIDREIDKKDNASFPENNIYQIDLFGEAINSKSKRKRINYHSDIFFDESKISYKLSEFGDIITLEYEGYTYVFFSNYFLSFEEIKELNTFLFPAYSKTQHLIETSISEECDWSVLNDETFEELCYDILCCHPYFDSESIQKMGKSKSRDGGRDIIIKSKRTPSKESELYIFQCKYLSEKTSMSTSKIPNAGNVILQYGAKGYGVFTTTVIDSTLHDMLDGFNSNNNIDTSFRWSKYELERFLNRNQIIKRKYFGK